LDRILFSDLLLKKYEKDGRGPSGFDCYGLVIEMYRRIGIKVCECPAGEGAKSIWKPTSLRCSTSKNIVIVAIAPKKDGIITHAGIVVKYNQMLHASEKKGICIEPLYLYSKFIEGYYEYAG